jgi:hypothetical protein
MWLQHDGAPPYFGRQVTEFFNKNYEGRWIGRGGPVAWPAVTRLNPLDFFLWVRMKSRVYHGGKPEERHQLVEAINDAAIGIRNELGCKQWQHSTVQ